MKRRTASALLLLLMCLLAGALASAPGDDPAGRIAAKALTYVDKTGPQLGYESDWCAVFVSRCARRTGIDPLLVPQTWSCTKMFNLMMSQQLWLPDLGCYAPVARQVDSPRQGDIVFYRSRKEAGVLVHVGIMVDGENSVQGNVSGHVQLMRPADYRYRNSGSPEDYAKAEEIIYLRPDYALLSGAWALTAP